MAIRSSRKRGRPPLPPGEGKRVPLNMRTTRERRDHLERAARASGRSLTQEVEIRVERSFLDEEARYHDFGGKLRYKQMRLVALVIDLVEEQMGANWQSDRKTYVEVRRAVDTFLEGLAPRRGKRSGAAALETIEVGPAVGEKVADAMLDSLRERLQLKNQTES